jgi:dTMP kinase
MTSGLFVTFEGPDGSGKTTQIRRLAQFLQASGYAVELTREPGGTVISDHIRTLLLAPEHTQMVAQTEILLYAASRAQHVHEKILPLLADNKIVLCDRFIDASIAYQGYGLDMEPDLVEQISNFAAAGLEPKRTYLLDIEPSAGHARILARAQATGEQALDRIERKPPAYHEKVRAGFHEIADCSPQRVKVIDANRSADEIFAEIHADFMQLLQQVDAEREWNGT